MELFYFIVNKHSYLYLYKKVKGLVGLMEYKYKLNWICSPKAFPDKLDY